MTIEPLEEELRREFDHYHVKAQVARFVQVFIGVMVTALAAAGFHVAGWAALGGLVGGCAWSALRQITPTIPWNTVLGVIRDRGDATTAPPIQRSILPPSHGE